MSRTPRVHVIDFETKAIDDRPRFPPEPVGVSIRKAGSRKGKYYAWNHPTGNNCTYAEGRKALQQVWEDSHTPLLFHNAKFDYAVATEKMGLPTLPWERIHDTLFLLFLFDPHSGLSLKPASEKHLGLPPEEQDAVQDWLIEQKIVRRDNKRWGAHICDAPGDLVGKYADGDTDRTLRLFRHFYPMLAKTGMGEAYDVERELMLHLLRAEQEGVRVDVDRLRQDVVAYRKAFDRVEGWMRKELGEPELDFAKKGQLADALDKAGIFTDWVLTKTGKRSTSKENMTFERFNDKKFARALNYRNRLQTSLSTFLEPWLGYAEESGGRIHTNWNQVKEYHAGGGAAGVRSGRISSSRPNLANIPLEFDDAEFPRHLRGLPHLPYMRSYILPNEGEVFLSRDYSQQELRILAHFIEGPFQQAYLRDPRMDAHVWVQRQIEAATGRAMDRSRVKTLNFADLYGMGAKLLAERMGVDLHTARRLRQTKRQMMAGLEEMERELKTMGKAGEPIVTWGGRLYYVEEARFSPEYGRWMSFEYKLPNYLIQGSAADCTKRALNRYFATRKDSSFLVQVYDEINISAPPGAVKKEMEILREAMESVEFDVPMLSEGEQGPNWHELVPYED